MSESSRDRRGVLAEEASFRGEPVQLLTPDGRRRSHPDVVVGMDDGEILAAYRDMVLVRRFDEEATALQRQGELGLWVSSLGQEATQVATARALRSQDVVFPTYREHGIAWCRGIDPVAVLGPFRGISHGGWDPREHGVHLYTLVIGAQTLHATGYAMGVQRDGAVGTGDPTRDTAVLAYFGDGASSEGDVSEAPARGGVQRPAVFVCQNNQWAISVPAERQSRVPLHRRSQGFGFPGLRVDGNDLLAVHAVTTAALDRARAGDGPTLIEAFTYRMAAHTTSDDPTRYRSEAEVEQWRGRDPVARVERYLVDRGLADEDSLAAVRAEGDALAERIRRECTALPDPDPETMFEHVYRDPHPLVAEERSWFAAYRASFLDDEVGG